MRALFDNREALLIVCCISGLVLGSYSMLFAMLRGDRRPGAEASRWTQAVGGGQARRKRQEADLDALHEAVAKLPREAAKNPDANEDE
jgi:hypothetical protein